MYIHVYIYIYIYIERERERERERETPLKIGRKERTTTETYHKITQPGGYMIMKGRLSNHFRRPLCKCYQANGALQSAVMLLGALQGAHKHSIIRSWGYVALI